MSSINDCPKARSENLIVRELDDETIVYDTRLHNATCLNEQARQVWGLCDGTREIDEIADACDGADVAMISQALKKLSKADLLETSFSAPPGTGRRAMLGQMAGLAAAVTVMTVPTAAQALSNVPENGTCFNDSDCAPIPGGAPCLQAECKKTGGATGPTDPGTCQKVSPPQDVACS